MNNQPTCSLCGEPMPAGEEMFKFHGYSGPCPKPPLPSPPTLETLVRNLQAHAKEHGWQDVDDPIAALLAWPTGEAGDKP